MNFLPAITPTRLRLLLIALPMALGALYYGLIAADRYVSISVVGLRQSSGDASSIPGTALLLSAVSTPGQQDTYYLRDYMTSLAMFNHLDKRLGLRTHYEAQVRDPLFRVWSWFTQEDMLDFYRARVAVTMDDLSAALTIRAEGFDPQFAAGLNRAILEESERFVNEYSHRIARENLAFAEVEVARAGDRLFKAKSEVLAFQNKNQLLDPVVQAQAAGALVTELQAQITRAETELRSLRSYLNDDSAQVTALRTQLQSLHAQLAAEKRRATGSEKQSERINTLAVEFQGLQLQADIALDAYKVALAAAEAARIESTRKLKNLVVIEPPSTPEKAEYPRRWYNLLTLLVSSLLIFAVVRLVLAAIREHQD